MLCSLLGCQLTPAKREPEFYPEPLKQQKITGFPVDSVSNFKVLRDQGFFYADKTKYIKEIEKDQDVLMFLWPKRFGKSLLLSTLKHFYDINEAPSFYRLFGSLDIYQHALELKHNQFLILEWNFSMVDRFIIFSFFSSFLSIDDYPPVNNEIKCHWNRCTSTDEMKRSLRNHINSSIRDFCENYAPLLGKCCKDLQNSIITPEDCIDSLKGLFRQVRLTPYKVFH